MKINRKPLVLAALGGIIASSAVPMAPVQAQPRFQRGRGVQNTVVSGVVQRDLVGQDRFTVKLDNGRTAEVISRRNEPFRLSKGDRVELRGDFERGLFIADSVRITRNVGGGLGNPGAGTTLKGRVVKDFFGRDFEIRTDNGAVRRIRSEHSEPIRLSNGDRVEVKGHFEGALFMARDVDILRNDDRQKVDFPGTVVRREGSGRLVVRGDNGRTFTIIANASLLRFDRQDRVRVVGFVNGDLVAAQSVVLLKNR